MFLEQALAGMAMTWPLAAGSVEIPKQKKFGGLIDVNVSLGAWPFRGSGSGRETAAWVRKLRKAGVTQAWAGSFEAMFQKDLHSVNDRLARDCRTFGRGILQPFGTVNPAAPDWREEWRRCRFERGMLGIRLFPGYHGYALDDARFRELLRMAAASGAVVQLALQMEDERMVHPRVQIPMLEAGPLAESVAGVRGLKLVLLNSFRVLRAKPLLQVLAAGDVFLEISSLEGMGGIESLLAEVPSGRVLFGSHAPFLYFESAILKLKESGLEGKSLEALKHANAAGLVAGV